MRGPNHFVNPRILVITLLGISSGLPLALCSSTLQAWFAQSGMDIMTVGVLSLIGLPYTWKFLWAPVMDRFIPPFLGRRRGWIVITQLGLCFTLFILAHLSPSTHTTFMSLLALLIAFLSASQDIAFDAYRTDVLLPKERGLGAAYYIMGYRIAMLISGGMAFMFADYLGWQLTYEIMAMLMASLTIVTYFSPEATDVPVQKHFISAIIDPFKELFKRDRIFILLAFICLYKFGDALALALMNSVFLQKVLGFSLTEIGLASKTGGLFATIIGALIGGTLLPRLGLYRGLLYFGIAQAVSNLFFMVLALTGKNFTFMFVSVFIENFCSGMSTAALVALIMELCHRQYSATQFACLSALAAIGRIFAGPITAKMVTYLGWPSFFAWTFIICIPGLMLLALLRNRIDFNAEMVPS